MIKLFWAVIHLAPTLKVCGLANGVPTSTYKSVFSLIPRKHTHTINLTHLIEHL